MKLSYRNWPVLQMMDRRYCAEMELKANGISGTDFEVKSFVENAINKGCLCDIPIYFVSKEFEKGYSNNWQKLSNLITENQSITREILENCVIILPNGSIFANIMTADRFMFFTMLRHGTIGNVRCGTWEEGRYLNTDEEAVVNLRQNLFGFLIVLAFKKFASVELDVIKPLSRKKTPLDPEGKGKVVNDTGIEVTLLDSTWFREIIRNEGFKVRGHFRLQPCKNDKGEWTHKLIYINEFEKHGYHRRAKMTIEDMSKPILSNS